MHDKGRRSSLPATLIAGTGVGGVGCAVPLLVLAAIFVGRALDRRLGTTPYILLGMLIGSIVLGVAFTVSSALSAARAAQSQYQATKQHIPDEGDKPFGEEG